MSEDTSTVPNLKCHVAFLHNRLRKRPEDRYIIDLAKALKDNGHEVTIITSHFDEKNCFDEVHPEYGNIEVKYSGWFLPQRWYVLQAIVMALRMCFLPPKPRPKVLILDTSTIILLILAKVTSYKMIFLTHFSALKELDYFSSYLKVTPDLFTAKTIRYADDIILENECLGDVFRRSFPNIKKELKYLNPCVDTDLWLEECIDVNRIVPDLPKSANLFVVFGVYKKRSNFKLALDAFENLLFIADEELKDKLHLVIAGNCSENKLDDMIYYDELIDMTKEKSFCSQVTFLKQLPTAHKKSLLKKCAALVAPARHDIFSNYLLEALAMGRPVIATNSGLARNILTHRITGILLEPDPQKFAAAMHKIVVNPMVQLFISEMASDLFRNQYSYNAISRKINSIVLKQLTVDKAYT